MLAIITARLIAARCRFHYFADILLLLI